MFAQPIAAYTKTWHSSGAGLFAQELVRAMLDAGADVVFVAPPAENEQFDLPRPGLTRFLSRRESSNGGKVVRIVGSLLRVFSSIRGLAKARLRTRIFLVSIPDPLVFALPMLFLLRLTGARICYIVHDPLPHAWKLPRRLRWLEDLGYTLAYAVACKLVVLSEASRSTLLTAYPVTKKPVHVIEHGVFVLEQSPPPAPGNGVLLLFGTLRRNKGVREAIEGVIAARKDGVTIRLIIAGMPDPVEASYWKECEPIAKEHPDAIDLRLGYVAQNDIGNLVAGCDAFLLPYRDFHSQSGVAMLAVSNARAVIASGAGGLGDLAADNMPGVVIAEPVSAKEVELAIAEFVSTPIAEWNTLSALYRRHTLELRAWPAIAAKYLELARDMSF